MQPQTRCLGSSASFKLCGRSFVLNFWQVSRPAGSATRPRYQETKPSQTACLHGKSLCPRPLTFRTSLITPLHLLPCCGFLSTEKSARHKCSLAELQENLASLLWISFSAALGESKIMPCPRARHLEKHISDRWVSQLFGRQATSLRLVTHS